MPRLARLELDCHLLRLLLDLPAHVAIEAVVQTAADHAAGRCALVISGPYLPEVGAAALHDADDLPVITPIFRRVEPGRTELVELRGLDT